jgi:hypothetical protein
MSLSSFGCRVVQRILENYDNDKRHLYFQEILSRTYDLTKDPYGIYVMTKILGSGTTEEKASIMDKMKMHAISMSKHKYGSNIIEKCLRKQDEKCS